MSTHPTPQGQSDLFRFATDVGRAHASEVIIARRPPIFPKPDLVVDANVRAAQAEEFFTEGRQHRHNAVTEAE